MALTIESLKPIFPKYDYKYTNEPKEACCTYLSNKSEYDVEAINEQVPHSVGEGKLTTEFIDWKGKSRGLFFQHPQGTVNVTCVKLSEDCKSPAPVICRERTKTRCTQTRYRESSAQTRSYQPEIAGDKENYQHFEVYEISKLLDTTTPPGEYETKVVERHRRRRKYEKALQLVKNDKDKHQAVLEAMEWEEWVAREEDIQGCQMLRMQIVMQMFKAREEKFRDMSEKRIACSADRIQAKRLLQLKKINVEYSRAVRLLEAKKQKITRSYHKGNITQEHIDPASDLHAPQMRFGVNPNRRHFVGFRRKFDDRINNLDKQKDERGLASLICPFSKLRSWAKPKERMREVSQRFCSDENLKNLYESLKGLRTISEATKPIPKCLKKKVRPTQASDSNESVKCDIKIEPEKSRGSEEEQLIHMDYEDDSPTSDEELIDQLHQRRAKELSSKNDREISTVVGEFEGTTLGKLLQFLSDELERLKQQKKFQAIYMLAERERWRREAFEAGLRQKENNLREDHEELFMAASEVHKDTASMFLESVLEEEFNFTSELLARKKIDNLAVNIDRQDLESIKLQGRERRVHDRVVMSDYVRNQVFAVAEARLKKIKAEKLEEAQLRAIEEELFADVKNALGFEYKTPDSVSIVGEVLDEVIVDAVTYDFDTISPRSSDDKFDVKREVNEIINKLINLAIRSPLTKDKFTDSTEFEIHLIAEREARAIIRKMVRRVIPEERKNPEAGRIVEQTLSETFNDTVYEVECLKASRYVRNNDKLSEIISGIYHRIGYYKNKDNTEESSESESSATLRSIRSTIDIFESPLFPESGFSVVEEEVLRHSMKKIDYIDTKQLPKYKPASIGMSHERYNIMGKVARRYQYEHSDYETLKIVGESSDISSTETSTSDEFGGFSGQFVELTKSRIISTPWLKTMHPELLVKRSSNLVESNSETESIDHRSIQRRKSA